jgi:NAD(P)-dependent dehydrogenase (short-subunit alcohol dehydrogenase family)
VREGEKRFGGIDVLVSNAGYGYRAAVEEGDDPVRAARAILTAVRAVIDAQLAELTAWEKTSLSTDFPVTT